MGVGGSYSYNKIEICNFLKERLYEEGILDPVILDVGAGGGTYKYYFGPSYNMEAVEIWPESIEKLKEFKYSEIYEQDIREFEYPKVYDLIIFGDIIEHLSVEDAQNVLKKAERYGKHIMVGVPFKLEQEAIYGNEAERHIQSDLTYELFKERYPGYKLIIGRTDLYGYFYK